MLRRLLALALPCLPACHGATADNSGFSTTPGVSSVDPASSGASTTGTGAPAEDSIAAMSTIVASTTAASTQTDADPFRDLPAPPDLGPAAPPGCKGKIDFLFTIASGFDMKSEQAQLKASFAGFIAVIQQEFGDFDYHIMVSNGTGDDPACAGCQGTCPDGPPGYTCDPVLEPCDDIVGAGQTFPRGWNASNHRCELFGGHRYIIHGEPDLLAAFTCIASVGTNGSYAVMNEARGAVSPEFNPQSFACNTGFLRDDALLVLTVITDADDDVYSADQPKDWAKTFRDLKKDDDGIVSLLIFNDKDLLDGVCKPYIAAKPVRLREWQTLMPHTLAGSTCAPSYAPFLADAAQLIKSQCDAFVPQ